jgi:hypothetical protein
MNDQAPSLVALAELVLSQDGQLGGGTLRSLQAQNAQGLSFSHDMC